MLPAIVPLVITEKGVKIGLEAITFVLMGYARDRVLFMINSPFGLDFLRNVDIFTPAARLRHSQVMVERRAVCRRSEAPLNSEGFSSAMVDTLPYWRQNRFSF